ncbi:MAG: hypothetical protein JRJ80_08600 [Deltaproteobacteria bacterium]|nr:hypothetical protein [Deltaproteobacteria bacterium]
MGPRLRPSCRLLSRIALLLLAVCVIAVGPAGAGGPAVGTPQDTDPKGEPYRPGDLVAVPAEADASVEEDEDEEFRDP